MYKLADRLQLVLLGERVYFIDDEMLELEGCSEAVIRALQELKNGCEREQLAAILADGELTELLDFLKEQNWLRVNWSNDYRSTIVEKQIYYLDDFSEEPNRLQNRLSAATVALIGVGGVGSVVVQHLVGAGVKSFVLIDRDTVQLDNLNRQFLFTRNEVGMSKVEAAAAYIRAIDPEIQVQTYRTMIDSEDSLSFLNGQPIDLLINAADSPNNLEEILMNYCQQTDRPFLGGGVGRHVGTWGPLLVPHQTRCGACFYRAESGQMDELEQQIREAISPMIQASFGPTNTVISTLLAKDAIHFLAGTDEVLSLDARCQLDFRTMQFHRFTPDAQVKCTCWRGNEHVNRCARD